MEDTGTWRGSRYRCLMLLLFLFVHLPLDACDADTCDAFEGGVVQVRGRASEPTVHPILHPAVNVPEIPRAVVELRMLASVSKPVITLPITRRTFHLPRPDDPHVAPLGPVKSPAYPFVT